MYLEVKVNLLNPMSMIYVFKTSVNTKKDVRQLKPLLNKLLLQAEWNFDLQDCDRILRIDSQKENSEAAIKVLKGKGFDCEELPD